MSASHREMVQPGVVLGQWWHRLDDGRIQCDLCPRECKLREGQRGFCFVRQAQNGGVVLTTYGRASGFCIDPIEKKPLNPLLSRHERVVVRDSGLQPRLPVLPELGQGLSGRAGRSVGDTATLGC